MKRKLVLSLLSFGLAMSLLAGCGSTTNTASTDNTKDNDVIETTTQASEEETLIDGVDTRYEVDMGDLAFYKNLSPYGEYTFDDITFEAIDEFELTSIYYFPLYNKDGICVGYIKNGRSVTITEKGVDSSWFRFKNPVEGTDYDYLYAAFFDIPQYGTASNLYTPDEYFALLDAQLEERYEKATASREKYLKENPSLTSEDYPEEIKCTRVDSKEGLTFYGEDSHSLYKEDCDGDLTEDGTIAIYAYSLYRHYEEVYFEVLDNRYGHIDYNVYVKEKEN
jgi:hypothetical protein